MNLFFKQLILAIIILLMVPISAKSREIIIINFNKANQTAETINKILIEQQNIPKEFIKLQQRNSPCEKSEDTILQICITDKGMVKFPIINKDIITSSLASFALVTAASNMVSPMRTMTAPSACFARTPVSIIIERPSPKSMVS